MVTALIYLNDVEEGGTTKFTKLDLDVSPSTGKLLIFENTLKDSIQTSSFRTCWYACY